MAANGNIKGLTALQVAEAEGKVRQRSLSRKREDKERKAKQIVDFGIVLDFECELRTRMRFFSPYYSF